MISLFRVLLLTIRCYQWNANGQLSSSPFGIYSLEYDAVAPITAVNILNSRTQYLTFVTPAQVVLFGTAPDAGEFRVSPSNGVQFWQVDNLVSGLFRIDLTAFVGTGGTVAIAREPGTSVVNSTVPVLQAAQTLGDTGWASISTTMTLGTSAQARGFALAWDRGASNTNTSLPTRLDLTVTRLA